MDKVVLPLSLPDNVSDGVVLSDTAPGFQPLAAAWNIGNIGAFYLKAPVTQGTDGANTAHLYAGESAIPDVCAHILYLRNELRNEQRKNALNLEDEAIRAWVGVLAIIALGYPVYVKTVDMSCDNTECMKKAYQEALKKAKMLDANDRLYVLCWNDTELAAIDPPDSIGVSGIERCFCYPFSTIDDKTKNLSNIPWFVEGIRDDEDSQPHQWLDVTGNYPRTTTPMLNPASKGLFAQMLSALMGNRENDALVFARGTVARLILRLKPTVVNLFENGAIASLVKDNNPQMMGMQQAANTMNNDPAAYSMMTAWYGILSCIGLSKVKSYRIELEKLDTRSFLMDWVYNIRAQYRGFQLKELIQLKVNGVVVGILDPVWLVRPLYYNYSNRNIANVGWHIDANQQNPDYWYPVELMGEEAIGFEEKCKLAGWFNELAVQVPAIAPYLQEKEKAIYNVTNRVYKKGEHCSYSTVATLASGVLTDGMNTVSDAYLSVTQKMSSVPDFKIPMPDDDKIFTRVLALTLADKMAGRRGHNRLGVAQDSKAGTIDTCVKIVYIDRSSDNNYEEEFQAFLPLRSDFTKDYFTTGKLTLTSFKLSYFEESRQIMAEMKVKNGQEDVVRRCYYYVGNFSFESGTPNENVRFFKNCPYVSLWPYINSPQWKKYYVTVHDDIHTDDTSGKLFNGWGASALRPVYLVNESNPLYKAERVKSKGDDKAWDLQEYRAFPDHIHFGYQDGMGIEEVGSIFVARPEEKKAEDGNVCAAMIDFGTSNTIVRMVDNQGITDSDVFSGQWVKPLVQNGDMEFIRRVYEFHKYYWFNFDGSSEYLDDLENIRKYWEVKRGTATDHIPTVVHLFEGARDGHSTIPRYGYAMRTDCEVMSYFLNYGGTSSKSKTPETYGVRSYIKSEKDDDPTAGSVFIETTLLQCVLKALDRGCALQAVISYPDKKTWENPLSNFWSIAVTNAKGLCESIQVSEDAGSMMTTSELWGTKCYAEKHIGKGKVNNEHGYCVVDIGGGTSDISVMKGTTKDDSGKVTAIMKGALSVRYAGRQIISESVFSAYCKNKENFEVLWQVGEDGAQYDFMEKMKYGFSQLKDKGFQVETDVKRAKEYIPMMTDRVMETFNRNYNGTQKKNLRALIGFKLGNVLYVVANYIRELEIINSEQLNPEGKRKNTDGLGVFTVIFAGGGASAREMCGVHGGTYDVDAYLASIMKKVIMERSYRFYNASEQERKSEVVVGIAEQTTEKLKQGGRGGNIAQLTREDVAPNMKDVKRTTDSGETCNHEDDEVFRHDRMKELTRQSYNAYVEGIVKGAEILEYEGGHTIYELLTLTNNSTNRRYIQYVDSILSEVEEESEATTSESMIAHIAATKIADHILLVDKFK